MAPVIVLYVLLAAAVMMFLVTPIHASLPPAAPLARSNEHRHDDVRILSVIPPS